MQSAILAELEHQRIRGANGIGFSIEDFGELQITDRFIDALTTTLRVDPSIEIPWLYWVMVTLSEKGRIGKIPREIQLTAKLLAINEISSQSSRCAGIAYDAIHATVLHEDKRILLCGLDSPHPEVRMSALSRVKLEKDQEVLKRLIRFRYDNYISEIAMSGPLRFVLRDEAYCILRRIFGLTCRGTDVSELHEGQRISYYSWEELQGIIEKYEKQD